MSISRPHGDILTLRHVPLNQCLYQVFVSDNTYTDFCYNASLSVTETINVRVIAINDAPTVQIPTLKTLNHSRPDSSNPKYYSLKQSRHRTPQLHPLGSTIKSRHFSRLSAGSLSLTNLPFSPFHYFQVSYPRQPMSLAGTRCKSDYMKNKNSLEGINSECSGKDYTGSSDIPPKPYTPTSSSVNFSDPDLSDTPYGNLSVILTVGNNVKVHGNAGQFFLPKLRYPEFDSKAWYTTEVISHRTAFKLECNVLIPFSYFIFELIHF
jgi:hypothetical protein